MVKPPSHFKDSKPASQDIYFESMSGYQREAASPRNRNMSELNWDELE